MFSRSTVRFRPFPLRYLRNWFVQFIFVLSGEELHADPGAVFVRMSLLLRHWLTWMEMQTIPEKIRFREQGGSKSWLRRDCAADAPSARYTFPRCVSRCSCARTDKNFMALSTAGTYASRGACLRNAQVLPDDRAKHNNVYAAISCSSAYFMLDLWPMYNDTRCTSRTHRHTSLFLRSIRFIGIYHVGF